MILINLNENKQDLIDFVVFAYFKDGTQSLVGFHQSMFFNIDNKVTDKTVMSITQPISISKIEKIVITKDKKLTTVTPNEFKEIIKKIESVK